MKKDLATRTGVGPVFLIFLAFISAFAPISTDLYLPALPSMSAYFNTTKEVTNFTLSGFILFFSLSMLVWGPLSDKYGRRPILLIGSAVYVAASGLCIASSSIYMLIFGRCVQAIGSGALSAVSTAMVKDRFEGKRMENVLAIVQTLIVIAPMLAPILGSLLLLVTSWRGIFYCLLACGALAFAGTLFLDESLPEKNNGSLWHSLGRLAVVLHNRGFRWSLLIFSANIMPLMAYLAVSSYIFQEYFGLSPQAYSVFFGVNAASSMLGPLLYVRFLRELPRNAFICSVFIAVTVLGALILLFAHTSPYVFAGLFLPMTFLLSSLRPCASMLMLIQHDSDAGSVSALMGCAALLIGAFSMFLCSLPWPSALTAIGVICVFMGSYCLAAWLYSIKKKIIRQK